MAGKSLQSPSCRRSCCFSSMMPTASASVIFSRCPSLASPRWACVRRGRGSTCAQVGRAAHVAA
eukprot:1232982-Prymnesium_polylepis.3